MRRILARLAPAALCVPLLIGCGPKNKYVGRYNGTVALTDKGYALIKQKKGKAAADTDVSQMRQMSMELELRNDKSFTMTTTAGGKLANTTNGTWSEVGQKIILSLPNAAAQPAEASRQKGSVVLNASADAKTLTPDAGDQPSGAQLETLTFNRS